MRTSNYSVCTRYLIEFKRDTARIIGVPSLLKAMLNSDDQT